MKLENNSNNLTKLEPWNTKESSVVVNSIRYN